MNDLVIVVSGVLLAFAIAYFGGRGEDDPA